MSFEDEAKLLEPFMDFAEAGQIAEISKILQAYEKALGRTFEKDQGANILRRV